MTRWLSILIMLVLMPSAAFAQAGYPDRRIHVVLPYPAGGIVDILTRIVTEKMAADLGQPIVVEPKPGANGNIAWDQVSRADADGYTWSFLSPALVANPRMQPSVKWSEKSFVPIGAAAWAPTVVVVHPDVPAKTVTEFFDYARANQATVNVVHPGIGTSNHLNTMIMLQAAKLNMTVVPYRGQPAAITDLLAGRVHMKIASIGLVSEHIAAGTLRALAVLGTARSPLLPNVPTMTEAGYPEINVVAWYGYVAPKDTPGPVVAKIAAAFDKAKSDPAVRAALEKQGLQVMAPMTPAAMQALLEADTEKYATVIRDANIRLGD